MKTIIIHTFTREEIETLDFGRFDALYGHWPQLWAMELREKYDSLVFLVDGFNEHPDEIYAISILDTKADGTAEQAIRHACFEAERENDFVVIKGDGGNFLDLFSEVMADGFSGIDALSALLASTIPCDPSNKYWERTLHALLTQSLRLIYLTENQEWDYTTLMKQLIRYLLHHQLRDPAYTEVVEQIGKLRDNEAPYTQFVIDEVIATHRVWDTLDFRTRSILQSMAASLTGVMNSETAHSCFSGEDPIDIASAVRDQKIVLISIDGIRQLPTLRSDLIQHDWAQIQLAACEIEVPEGLLDLPVCYVKCILDMIENTQWAFYPGTSPKIVFGWKSVKRFEESLEIEFHRPIPHPDHDWDQTAELLFTLHSRLEGFAWNLKYNDKRTD